MGSHVGGIGRAWAHQACPTWFLFVNLFFRVFFSRYLVQGQPAGRESAPHQYIFTASCGTYGVARKFLFLVKICLVRCCGLNIRYISPETI
jgi:hypothetical protein